MEGTIGEIRIFAGSYPPQNWQFCQGQTISIQDNVDLYSIIGTSYGGNGTTNFVLPNLSGKSPAEEPPQDPAARGQYIICMNGTFPRRA
jgi:microcystin-dependent protein